MSIRYIIIPVTPYQQNCTLLICEQSQQAAIIDPGGDIETILKTIKAQKIDVVSILVTHGHLDHVGAVAELAKRLGVKIEGPQRADQFWIDHIPSQVQLFGFPPSATFTPNRWLEEGDSVQIGEQQLDVIHCPGHTPGHIVFYHEPSKLAIVGDVLFKGSIGRTDFPQSSHADLIHSIKNKLWALGGEVKFIPGHGEMSTFATEMRSNPFVGID